MYSYEALLLNEILFKCSDIEVKMSIFKLNENLHQPVMSS